MKLGFSTTLFANCFAGAGEPEPDFRLPVASAASDATCEVSAPSPWKRVLRLANFVNFLRDQVDLQGFLKILLSYSAHPCCYHQARPPQYNGVTGLLRDPRHYNPLFRRIANLEFSN